MDAFASAAASRASWSKAQKRVNAHVHLHRKEPAVTLPRLSRRASGQQSSTPGVGPRNASLHAFLASQLENNERENYTRSQLRAMASSKLLGSSSSNNNNLSSSKIHSSAERLAPLHPASFEKSRAQRRPLPGPLQAAINEVLAVKASTEALSERGESRNDSNNDDFDDPETPVIPIAKRVSPRKTQLQSRRPEWQRYIRRIMMTKGIRGSTLARYRRLVGIVARRNLTHSYAGAAERVVRYRLEFRSAAAIQTMTRRFLTRRRQAKELQRHQAAAKIQGVCRRVLAVERKRKLAEIARLAEIERFRRVSAARIMQRSYRKYRLNRRLREEHQRQLQQASMLQKARLKLLRRYQSWRKSSKQEKVNPESGNNFSLTEVDISTGMLGGESSQCEEDRPLRALATEKLGQLAVIATVSENQSTETRNQAGFSAHDNQTNISESVASLKEFDEQSVENDAGCSVTIEADPEETNGESGGNAGAGGGMGAPELLSERELLVEGFQQHLGISAGEPLGDSHTQSNQLDPLESASLLKEVEEMTLRAEASSSIVEVGPEEGGSEIYGNKGMEPPGALSHLDIHQHLNNSVDAEEEEEEEEATSDLEAATVASTMFRAATAKKIAGFLLPKLQVRHALKTHAAIQIQCLARLYLAKQRLARVRLELLQSLRAQLLASWQPVQQTEQRRSGDERGVHNAVVDQNDEDEEFESEVQGHHQSLDAVSENYIHLLPTRNGQIPPGVPLLHSSAAAPLLPLWKWSWPGECWLSTGL